MTLPLTCATVRERPIPAKFTLPLRWKAVFIFLILYALVASAIIYGKISGTSAETAPLPTPAANTAASVSADAESPAAGTAQVTMTATVPGWYETARIDNTNLLVKTNMRVWVNGREFIRCDQGAGQAVDQSLLDL